MRNCFVVAKCVAQTAILILLVGNNLLGCNHVLPITSSSASVVQTDENKARLNFKIKNTRVLVFSKTKGWRHDSIPAGIAALQKMAADNVFTLVATENAEYFTDAQLSTFNAIVFLNTTLDVLNEDQQIAMERFIQAGGGFGRKLGVVS
jgi:cytochrome c